MEGSKSCLKLTHNNRKRHKIFCKSGDNSELKVKHDKTSQMIRSLSGTITMLFPLKNYVRTILNLDCDRTQGLRNMVVFTCTAVNDPVRKSPEAPEQLMLQISRVTVKKSILNEESVQHNTLPEGVGVRALMAFETDVPGARTPIVTFETLYPDILGGMSLINMPATWIG